MTRVVVVAVLFAALVGGCATKYQQAGFSGGVEDSPINSDTHRILARGNAFTSPEQTRDFVLLRASELAIAGGYTHFVILDAQAYSQRSTITSPGTYQSTTTGHATVYGNTAYGSAQTYGTYTAPTTTTFNKPRNEVIVRLQNGEGGGIAYDAKMIYANLAQRLKGSGELPATVVRGEYLGPSGAPAPTPEQIRPFPAGTDCAKLTNDAARAACQRGR